LKSKAMGKVFNGITVIAIIVIVFWIINLDYSDLSWDTNSKVYSSIIALVLIGIGMQYNRVKLQRKKQNEEN
tara:strand:+ start:115207 stop:115422 length:216 start_codon:yes stop_codon:yes gene_type:complete